MRTNLRQITVTFFLAYLTFGTVSAQDLIISSERGLLSWTVYKTSGGSYEMSFDNIEVDYSSPLDVNLIGDEVVLPTMTITNMSFGLTNIGGYLFKTVNATLTPIENKLYIVDDMTNNTVMQANLGSGGMLSISVIYLAYTNPNKDLTNLSTPVPGYSVVIDELIAAEDMGLAIDLSFSGDSTKELYDLLKGTSNVPVSGTLSGQISSEVLVDTNADLSETSFSQSTFIETILGQKSTLSNVEVSGDLSGTINFTNFEIVSIQTGSFAGKGFSKGQFQATLEGAAYTGDWNGLLFLKPDERKIYLKGATSGEISATVEGYLTESVPDSNVYDNYQATWKIGRVRDTTTSATIHISGILTYQGASEFPNTPLYILQSSIEGTASGHYTGPLSTVLTHLRINTVGNPYYGEGFSIISYVSNIGKGEAWAYNNLISPNISELKGISTGPLLGILSGKLDETASPRTLTLTVERIDLGLPPAPDLKVKVWGPGRVSPGQTVNYIIEYRNDGLKAADEALLFYGLDPSVKHISASAEANYDEFYHEVSWNLGVLPAKTARYTSVQVQVEWGLPWGTILDSSALILNMATYKVDVSNNLDSPSKPNLYLGGIDNAVDSNNWKKADAFASEVIAEHPKIYGLGLLQDLSDVTLAAPNYAKVYLGDHTMFGDLQYITVFDGTTYYIYFTRNDNNGLTKSEITNQKYGTVYAYSGGTRTALTAVLHDNLQCDRLVLISPNCGNEIPDYELYKWELEQVRKKYKDMEIVIYQSKKDFVPGGIRFSTKDKDWLQKNNIKVNPGTEEFGFKDPLVIDVMDKDGKIVKKEIKIDENINKQGHGELFSYIKSKLLDKEEMSSDTSSIVAVARDPNRKLGPDGRVLPGDKLQYRVEYENEGEGIAFGVYFTDTLDEDLNEATLEIGPVIDVNSGVQIAPPGTYNPATRTITWFVGQVDPNRGGCADFSVNVKPDAPHGTEIINFATVYFPSVPEATRTNGVVSIVSYNRPPVANAGPDQTVEQESYAGTQVVLDASGSTDPDSSTGTNDDIVSFDWYEGTVLLGTGQTLNHTFPLGSHTVILKVTDTFGETDTNEVIIVVQDTTPPQFTLSVSPTILKPVNHKMVRITPSWTLHDICDSSPQVSLVSIVANEGADTIGDGHTSPDIEIRNDGSIYVRAERSGTRTGRIYTITYQAVDDSGNVTVKSAIVTVPHDQR